MQPTAPRKYRLRPSAASSWIRCGASVRLRALNPKPSGLAAEAGTAAHYVGMQMLRGEAWSSIAPNGVVVTPDMVKGAKDYRDHVASWGVSVYIEQPIACPDIHEECGGTPDVWGYCFERDTIFICDYKFGYIMVDAFENWQLLCYVSGILTYLRACMVDTRNTKVQFTVVQPRVFHREPEPWITDVEGLRGYMCDLAFAAEQAIRADALAVVGDQCEYCDASNICETLKKSGYRAMAMSELPHIMELSLNDASLELARIEEAMDILESRKSGLAAQVEAQLMKGARAPMHELDRIKKRETWQEGRHGEVIVMGRLLGKDLAEPVKALTPSKARQLGIDESIIKQYSTTPTGELKLVRMSTKQTRKLFGESKK